MVGIIVRHGIHVVVATAPTTEDAEQIAMQLLHSEGVDLENEDVTMLVFDPSETGGVIMTTDQPPDMAGWSMDGFTPG
tara:strand:- start:48599 stop:48832 length:234 start_codon:yes stop_codon:yes gene_type:complete